MKLFFIRADDDNGECLDQLVVAPNAAEARAIWQAHHVLDDNEPPDWVGEVPNVSPHPDQPAGVVEWRAIRPE